MSDKVSDKTIINLSEHRIKEGDYITVIRWKTVRDNSYRGDVLKIIAINKPFIVVQATHGGLKGYPISLCLDMVDIKKLSDEYAAAMAR